MNIKGLKIALVGSSGLLTTYKGLADALRAQGAIVTNLGLGGTSAEQWLRDVACFPGKDPQGCKAGMPRFVIADELAKVGGKFDLVIGQLGANDGANASAGKRPGGVDAPKWVPRMMYVMSRFAPRGFYIMPGAERGTATDAVGKHYTDANVRPYGLAMQARIGKAAFDAYPISKRYIDTVGDGMHFPANSAPARELVAAIVQHVLANEPVSLVGIPKPTGAGGGQYLTDEPGSRASDAGGSRWPWIVGGLAALGLGAFLLWRRAQARQAPMLPPKPGA